MRIQLKNIGMIKEADVSIEGLTVIAGENDTGKSTVGKVLFSIIKSDNIAQRQNLSDFEAKRILATRLNLVFDGNITLNGEIKILNKNNKEISFVKIKDKNFIQKYHTNREDRERFFDATFVQSPVILDMVEFFNNVARMKERKKYELGLDFDVSYPYMMWDLYDKLLKENPFPHAKRQQRLRNKLVDIISGHIETEQSKFYYHKRIENSTIKVEMENTATGIKSFGIIQLLNDNRFFSKKNLLILDEPEVHLHPKWQLKMAEIIVFLVKQDVKVLLNTHSPYMVEALQRYSERAQIDNDFYLAEEAYIQKIENNNSKTLSRIFSKLSEPFDIFDEMDSRALQNG